MAPAKFPSARTDPGPGVLLRDVRCRSFDLRGSHSKWIVQSPKTKSSGLVGVGSARDAFPRDTAHSKLIQNTGISKA